MRVSLQAQTEYVEKVAADNSTSLERSLGYADAPNLLGEDASSAKCKHRRFLMNTHVRRKVHECMVPSPLRDHLHRARVRNRCWLRQREGKAVCALLHVPDGRDHDRHQLVHVVSPVARGLWEASSASTIHALGELLQSNLQFLLHSQTNFLTQFHDCPFYHGASLLVHKVPH